MYCAPRAADIVDAPHLVAPLPYLNFLRYFKRKHPRFGLRRLLQEAPAYWDALTKGQKNMFQRQRILSRSRRLLKAKKRCLQRNKGRPRKRDPVRRPIYDTRPSAPQLRRSKRQRQQAAAKR